LQYESVKPFIRNKDIAPAAHYENLKVSAAGELECGGDIRLGPGAKKIPCRAADAQGRKRSERNIFKN
jgi:hypothetical protein